MQSRMQVDHGHRRTFHTAFEDALELRCSIDPPAAAVKTRPKSSQPSPARSCSAACMIRRSDSASEQIRGSGNVPPGHLGLQLDQGELASNPLYLPARRTRCTCQRGRITPIPVEISPTQAQ